MDVVGIHAVVNGSFSELCVLTHLGNWKLLGAGASYSGFGAVPCRGGQCPSVQGSVVLGGRKEDGDGWMCAMLLGTG